MNYLLLFINIIMLVAGQVLFKQASMSGRGILSSLINPYTICGGFIYVLATVLWIYLLSREDLSRIYPLQSLCYVFGALAGVLCFGEKLSGARIAGLFLIICGACFIGLN